MELLGANVDAINKAEDRELFKAAMEKIGLEVCRGRTVKNLKEAREVLIAGAQHGVTVAEFWREWTAPAASIPCAPPSNVRC